MYPGNPQGGMAQGGMGGGMGVGGGRSLRPRRPPSRPSSQGQPMQGQPMQGMLRSLAARNQGARPFLPSISAPQMRAVTRPQGPSPQGPIPQGNAFGLARRINEMKYAGPNEVPPSQGFGAGFGQPFRPPAPIDPAPGMMGSIAPPLGPDAVQGSFSRPQNSFSRGRWGF